MNCYVHPGKEAVGTCVNCGKFICSECNTEVDNKNLCKHCVSEIMQRKATARPSKDKTTAAILGILLGSFGAHKFYMGKTGQGVLYLIFCWAFIPGVLGLIEGITYLGMSEDDFLAKCVNV